MNTLQVFANTGERFEAIDVRRFVFPGGEVQVQCAALPERVREVRIDSDLRSSDDIMALLLLTDALRRMMPVRAPLRLRMPYVPYARQDRVCNPGEALSAKVLCELINAQGYDEVTILDPHSDVVGALIDRVRIIQPGAPASALARRPEFAGEFALVCPDAGARKRTVDIAKALGVHQVVYADKQRDLATGRILDMTVSGPVPATPLLVVDDICDGGATFVELAAVLRRHTDAPLYLYVSHGLFTKGLAPLLDAYARIFTPNNLSGLADERLVIL
jgi:ribose-phosphate pyrophosphokinase